MGNEKTRELVVSNVNDYDTNVVVERVPEKKGFRVLCVSLYFYDYFSFQDLKY